MHTKESGEENNTYRGWISEGENHVSRIKIPFLPSFIQEVAIPSIATTTTSVIQYTKGGPNGNGFCSQAFLQSQSKREREREGISLLLEIWRRKKQKTKWKERKIKRTNWWGLRIEYFSC